MVVAADAAADDDQLKVFVFSVNIIGESSLPVWKLEQNVLE